MAVELGRGEILVEGKGRGDGMPKLSSGAETRWQVWGKTGLELGDLLENSFKI